MTKKKPKRAQEPDLSVLDRANAACDESVRTLQACVGRLTAKIEGSSKYDRQAASHLAWLTAQITSIMGELRQQEKATKRALTSFADDEIIEYVKGLPDRRREAFITAVQGQSLAGKPLFP